MTHKRVIYVLAVALLTLFVAAAATAQDNNAPVERIDTAMLVLGQPFVPDGPAKVGVVEEAAPAQDAVMPPSDAAKLGLAPERNAPNVNIYFVRETFEGIWPNGNWYTFDNNGATGGQVCWNDTSYKWFRGHWSGGSMTGCANGVYPTVNYPNNMESWMVNGPFSTVNALYGKLNFKYWNVSELNYDYLWWCLSPNGTNFYCKRHTGNSGGWKSGTLNMKSVPGYGNMLGDPTVWAAWVFTSDSSITYKGAFVDNAGIKAWR